MKRQLSAGVLAALSEGGAGGDVHTTRAKTVPSEGAKSGAAAAATVPNKKKKKAKLARTSSGRYAAAAPRAVTGNDDAADAASAVELAKGEKRQMQEQKEIQEQEKMRSHLKDNPEYFDDVSAGADEPLISKDKKAKLEAATHSNMVQEACEGIMNRGKKMFGLAGGEDEPEDSYWIPLWRYNPKKKKKVRSGAVLVSVEILPQKLVKTFPAGKGRSDPNGLPAPVGRISLSLNPMRMMFQLLGPHVYNRLCCCVASILAGVLAYFMYDWVTQFWLVFSTLLGSASNYAWVFFLMFLMCLCCACCATFGFCMGMGRKQDCKICGINCAAKGGKHCPCCC